LLAKQQIVLLSKNLKLSQLDVDRDGRYVSDSIETSSEYLSVTLSKI